MTEDVAAAVTYSPEKDKFLVLKRADSMEVFPGRWDFPSGKIEDEEPRKAALRELKEETGLSGKILRTGRSFELETGYGGFRVHPFLVKVDSCSVSLGPEHVDYKWVEVPELSGMETVKALEHDLKAVGVKE